MTGLHDNNIHRDAESTHCDAFVNDIVNSSLPKGSCYAGALTDTMSLDSMQWVSHSPSCITLYLTPPVLTVLIPGCLTCAHVLTAQVCCYIPVCVRTPVHSHTQCTFTCTCVSTC